MAHPIRLFKYPTTGPEDTGALQRLKAEEGYGADDVMAVVGKTEGNGCVNDFSRTLSSSVWHPLIPPSSIAVFSGGTEGVLNPHVSFIVKEKAEYGPTGLLAMTGRTRRFEPDEVGTEVQVKEVEATVKAMLAEAKLSVSAAHLVLVKCPLLTSSKIASIRSKGLTPVTTDTYESMAKSRYATALGIAVALGELSGQVEEVAEALRSGGEKWSAKASCSSGAELDDCHILVLASDEVATTSLTSGKPKLRAVSSYMKDAIDAEAILALLSHVRSSSGRVVQVFTPTSILPGMREQP
ncbi:hypothetical protein JCM21900_004213 [Sporobolomyces salmonicolor]